MDRHSKKWREMDCGRRIFWFSFSKEWWKFSLCITGTCSVVSSSVTLAFGIYRLRLSLSTSSLKPLVDFSLTSSLHRWVVKISLLSNHAIILPSSQLKIKGFWNVLGIAVFQALNHLFPTTIMFTKQSFYCFLPRKGSSDRQRFIPGWQCFWFQNKLSQKIFLKQNRTFSSLQLLLCWLRNLTFCSSNLSN